VKIVASGGLDECDLESFSQQGIPYDSYGVGTRMGVSADAPWFDVAYKLVEYDDRPVLKLSTGKVSWPGKKQVFRVTDDRGRLVKDLIALRGERFSEAKPLLEKVMENGKIIGRRPSLRESRERFAEEFKCLDEAHKAIRSPSLYPVELSPELDSLRDSVGRQLQHAS
jgi:nicotinate phosphoribosyltransferase